MGLLSQTLGSRTSQIGEAGMAYVPSSLQNSGEEVSPFSWSGTSTKFSGLVFLRQFYYDLPMFFQHRFFSDKFIV